MPTPDLIEKLQQQEKQYEGLSDQEIAQKVLETTGPMVRMSIFIQSVKDFRYVGQGVALGDAGRIICRFTPPGSDTERIVYGDLRIADAPSEE